MKCAVNIFLDSKPRKNFMLLIAHSWLANMLAPIGSCSFIVDMCDIDIIAQVNLKALGFYLIRNSLTYSCHGNGVYIN